MNEPVEQKPTPEEILTRVKKEEKTANRGRMKLFLGFAAGVGKTYSMLSEANRRSERGEDVVIGLVETHGRKGTEEQLGSLEIIPRKKVTYKDTVFEEMDTGAIIARHPGCVVVDELAHTNVPGSLHAKRYEDVNDILSAGIDVLTTMNVQHIESLNDTVSQITGIKVRETVPDWVLGEAEEIVSVDITPRALINRMERGDIYSTEKVPQALAHFFTEGNLAALREIALREVASGVDRNVQGYREEHDVHEAWQTQERVLVCISPDRPSDKLLRRGWRIASRLRADIVAVYVATGALSAKQEKILDGDFSLAERLTIRVERLSGTDVAQALADYANKHQVTQIVIGHSEHTAVYEFFHGSIINKLIRLVRDIDVLVMRTSG